MTEVSQITIGMNVNVAGFLQGRESGGQPDSHLYETFMMAAMKIAADRRTDAFVYYLAAKQRPAGNWHSITTRPPIQDGDINRTAMAIRALAVYGTPARKAEFGGSHRSRGGVAGRADAAQHGRTHHAAPGSLVGRTCIGR